MSYYCSKVLAVSILVIVSLAGCGRPRMESMERWQRTEMESTDQRRRAECRVIEVYEVGKNPDVPYEEIDTIEVLGDVSISAWEFASFFPLYLRPFIFVGSVGHAENKSPTETDLIKKLIGRARNLGGDAILMTKKSKEKCAAVVIRWKKSEK